MSRKSRVRAFSLVELVIVVVIIGVIAAIAVPRISRGAKGAGESALRGSLASLRNSIDMFAAEHNGRWPGTPLNTEAALLDHLTKKTDAGGNVGTTAGVHVYGPYLRGGFPPVPVGPNVGQKGVIMTSTVPIATAVDEAQTTMGWVYNYTTGEIVVNTDDTDEATVAYSSY
jgi:prepilin-type N-terminal cleavage/methylation domain-containing protein